MGKCVFCGETAGLLRRSHKKCRDKRREAEERIPSLIAEALDSEVPIDEFKTIIADFADVSYVGSGLLRTLALAGVNSMIDRALDDHLLSESERERVLDLCSAFDIDLAELAGGKERLVKAAILADLSEGRIPERVSVQNMPSVNLARGERVVWLFNDVTYYLTRSKTQYVGASHGVSVRIARGIYYRIGAFKGEPVKTQYLSEEGVGTLILTTKAVYFVSSGATVKIPVRKIVSIIPHADGIQVTREAANARPQVFMLDDPWFAANAVIRINQLD